MGILWAFKYTLVGISMALYIMKEIYFKNTFKRENKKILEYQHIQFIKWLLFR